MIKFFLDEMFSSVIAEIGRSAGVDVVSVDEVRQKGADDDSVLLMAARDERCVVTVNHKDFVPMTARFFDEGLPHAGVLLVAGSVPTDAYAAIANAIIRFARDNPDGMRPYEIRWLSVSHS